RAKPVTPAAPGAGLADVALPTARAQRPDEQAEQRRLARSVRPEHPPHLPRTHGEVDAVKNPDPPSAPPVGGITEPFGPEVSSHRAPFRRRSNHANTGAPTAAVTMPTGNSCGANTVRASVSAQVRKIAPVSAASGSTSRWPLPTSSRTTWGNTRPTNPIAPETLTIAPVSRAVAVSSSHRDRATSTPREAAATSPN